MGCVSSNQASQQAEQRTNKGSKTPAEKLSEQDTNQNASEKNQTPAKLEVPSGTSATSKPTTPQNLATPTVDSPTAKSPKSASPRANAKAAYKQETDPAKQLELIQTLSLIAISIYRSLAQALENEHAAFQKLALKRGYNDYIELARITSITKLLGSWYECDASMPQNKGNPHFKRQLFGNMLESCSRLIVRNNNAPDSGKFVQKLQEAVRKTADSLGDTVLLATSSDLKQHLLFFQRSFRVLQGDIYTVEALEANMSKYVDDE